MTMLLALTVVMQLPLAIRWTRLSLIRARRMLTVLEHRLLAKPEGLHLTEVRRTFTALCTLESMAMCLCNVGLYNRLMSARALALRVLRMRVPP